MLKIIHKLRIKQKFFLITCYFILALVISEVGLYEIAKTSNFQKMKRVHLAYLDKFSIRTMELKKLKNQAVGSGKIEKLIDDRSDNLEKMGLIRILEGLNEIEDSFQSSLNFVETFIFRVFGFNDILRTVAKIYDETLITQKAFHNYKDENISLERLIDKLDSYITTIRNYDSVIEKNLNSITHSIHVTIIVIVSIVMALIGITGTLIINSVIKSLNNAKNNIYSSSQELQANSKQQLQAATELAASMSEISSVMQELAATSRQVSDLSSDTSNLAENASNAVDEGLDSLSHAMQGINKIKDRVEAIVSNMLALSEKSQQMGIVLDVINELSQQVTVLSYNATIEAAGAGEAGKRFMAVADRIIKLAERSVESGKEIKLIIDDIQTDSNKTIMSTEDGMKAVEEGINSAHNVKGYLDKINDFTKQMLSSANESNISLSQQKTGIEQAAQEVENITIRGQETENSSKQVKETSDYLYQMASELENI
ncbi:MAG: hypothetical protein J7L16_11000 [Deltaproteobacteria bacterium]|nr:hypothetical protein [Deltaproteobacteria bacterium]